MAGRGVQRVGCGAALAARGDQVVALVRGAARDVLVRLPGGVGAVEDVVAQHGVGDLRRVGVVVEDGRARPGHDGVVGDAAGQVGQRLPRLGEAAEGDAGAAQQVPDDVVVDVHVVAAVVEVEAVADLGRVVHPVVVHPGAGVCGVAAGVDGAQVEVGLGVVVHVVVGDAQVLVSGVGVRVGVHVDDVAAGGVHGVVRDRHSARAHLQRHRRGVGAAVGHVGDEVVADVVAGSLDRDAVAHGVPQGAVAQCVVGSVQQDSAVGVVVGVVDPGVGQVGVVLGGLPGRRVLGRDAVQYVVGAVVVGGERRGEQVDSAHCHVAAVVEVEAVVALLGGDAGGGSAAGGPHVQQVRAGVVVPGVRAGQQGLLADQAELRR